MQSTHPGNIFNAFNQYTKPFSYLRCYEGEQRKKKKNIFIDLFNESVCMYISATQYCCCCDIWNAITHAYLYGEVKKEREKKTLKIRFNFSFSSSQGFRVIIIQLCRQQSRRKHTITILLNIYRHLFLVSLCVHRNEFILHQFLHELYLFFFWQLVYSHHERNEKYIEIISQFHFSCSPFFFFISTRNCLFMTIKIVSHFVYLFFILCRPWKTELGIVRKWSIKKNKFFQKVWRKKKSFFFCRQ